MNRSIRALIAVAAVTSGFVFAMPAAASSQEVATNGISSGVRCSWHTHPDVSRNVSAYCSYGGKERGLINWGGRGGEGHLKAWDTARDGRSVSSHAVWTDKNGKRHKKAVADGYIGKDTEIRFRIPDRTEVHVFFCVQRIGCSGWRKSMA